jgi:Rrf2 family protein
MLDLAKETVWGLYALHSLASRERMTSAAEIARQGGIPRGALAPILKKLRDAGLLRGRPGHGYALDRPAGTISVSEVAALLENAEAPAASCMNRYDACAYTESCAMAPLCREAHERARSAMRSFTVADLRESPAALADCAAPHKRKKRDAMA